VPPSLSTLHSGAADEVLLNDARAEVERSADVLRSAAAGL
jgi:hypothetical protein